nr:MAG TPA: hypothetical protein [Caudoviricetes sp.]
MLKATRLGSIPSLFVYKLSNFENLRNIVKRVRFCYNIC